MALNIWFNIPRYSETEEERRERLKNYYRPRLLRSIERYKPREGRCIHGEEIPMRIWARFLMKLIPRCNDPEDFSRRLQDYYTVTYKTLEEMPDLTGEIADAPSSEAGDATIDSSTCVVSEST